MHVSHDPSHVGSWEAVVLQNSEGAKVQSPSALQPLSAAPAEPLLLMLRHIDSKAPATTVTPANRHTRNAPDSIYSCTSTNLPLDVSSASVRALSSAIDAA